MALPETTQQEADDLLTAAQALQDAARKITDTARQLRSRTLLPTWGYAYARMYVHTAEGIVDAALNDATGSREEIAPPAPPAGRNSLKGTGGGRS